jgi:hypothetical protein
VPFGTPSCDGFRRRIVRRTDDEVSARRPAGWQRPSGSSFAATKPGRVRIARRRLRPRRRRPAEGWRLLLAAVAVRALRSVIRTSVVTAPIKHNKTQYVSCS